MFLLTCGLAQLLSLVSAQDDPLAALAQNIPGVPGEDYPIFVNPPDTGFDCDKQIECYYSDQDADCQAFHICGNDGSGSLIKYSFLCPNGTLFNQQYFICDWWFNVDCSLAQSLYSRNNEVAAERQRYTSSGGQRQSGGQSANRGQSGANSRQGAGNTSSGSFRGASASGSSATRGSSSTRVTASGL